jgi:hypothetical protein
MVFVRGDLLNSETARRRDIEHGLTPDSQRPHIFMRAITTGLRRHIFGFTLGSVINRRATIVTIASSSTPPAATTRAITTQPRLDF